MRFSLQIMSAGVLLAAANSACGSSSSGGRSSTSSSSTSGATGGSSVTHTSSAGGQASTSSGAVTASSQGCGDLATACGAFCDLVCHHCPGVDVGATCAEAAAGVTDCGTCATNMAAWQPACGATGPVPSCGEDAGNSTSTGGSSGSSSSSSSCTDTDRFCKSQGDCCSGCCLVSDAGPTDTLGVCMVPAVCAAPDAGPPPPPDSGPIEPGFFATFSPGGAREFDTGLRAQQDQSGAVVAWDIKGRSDAGGESFELLVSTGVGTSVCGSSSSVPYMLYTPDAGSYFFVSGSCSVTVLNEPNPDGGADAGPLMGTFSATLVEVVNAAPGFDVYGTFDVIP